MDAATLTDRIGQYVDALNAADLARREATAQAYRDRGEPQYAASALTVGETFTTERGTRYTKVVATHQPGAVGRSVHAFVDVDGLVYKAAGWARPAKGPRYSLTDDDGFARLLAAVAATGGSTRYLYRKG